MKLKDYLKQFDGLDPEIEIYLEAFDNKGIANGECYKKPEFSTDLFPVNFNNSYERVWINNSNKSFESDGVQFTKYVLHCNEEYNKEILLMVRL